MYTIANNNNLFAVYDNSGLVEEFNTKGSAMDFVDSLKRINQATKLFNQAEAGTIKLIGNLPDPKIEDERVIDKPTTASVKFMQTGKMPSKADLIREQIGLAKANGIGAEIVVMWAVAELNMKKPLAKAYVKENWAKVQVWFHQANANFSGSWPPGKCPGMASL